MEGVKPEKNSRKRRGSQLMRVESEKNENSRKRRGSRLMRGEVMGGLITS